MKITSRDFVCEMGALFLKFGIRFTILGPLDTSFLGLEKLRYL